MKVKNTTGAQKAYADIKKQIVYGDLMPNQLLDIRALTEQLGLGSITPVREALIKLEIEKLVTIIPRKGIFVTDISIEDVINNFQVRELLEPAAVKQASQYLSEDFCDIWQEKFEHFNVGKSQYEFEEYLELDANFHLELIEPLGNPQLLGIVRNLYEQNIRYRLIIIKNRSMNCMLSEHGKIISCIRTKDFDAVQTTLEAHIRNSKNDLLSKKFNLAE